MPHELGSLKTIVIYSILVYCIYGGLYIHYIGDFRRIYTIPYIHYIGPFWGVYTLYFGGVYTVYTVFSRFFQDLREKSWFLGILSRIEKVRRFFFFSYFFDSAPKFGKSEQNRKSKTFFFFFWSSFFDSAPKFGVYTVYTVYTVYGIYTISKGWIYHWFSVLRVFEKNDTLVFFVTERLSFSRWVMILF